MLRLKEYFGLEGSMLNAGMHVHEQHCDNKGAVQQIKKKHAYKGYYPNDTLESDWDLIEEIRQSIYSLGFDRHSNEFAIQWVKGHQDDEKSWEELTIPERLNCRADELAENYRENHIRDDLTRVVRLPRNMAQLHFPEGTITRNIKNDVRVARTAKPLLDYIIERETKHSDWQEHTHLKVDWTCHGRAIARFKSKKVTVVKFLHDVLPVGKIVHRYHQANPVNCSECGAFEHHKHLYRCPKRSEWKKQIHRNLRKKMDRANTDSVLAQIALEGIQSLVEDRDFQPPRLSPAQRQIYQQLIDEQCEIGWHNFLKGRWSTEWCRLQEAHLQSMNAITHHKNGKRWVVDMIACLWRDIFALWAIRNEQRHGRDSSVKATKEREQLLREIDLLFESACDIHPDDAAIFDGVVYEELVETCTGNIYAWKKNWEPAIIASKARYKRELRLGGQDDDP